MDLDTATLSDIAVCQYGYCAATEDQLLTIYREQGAEAITGLPGNFIAVLTGSDETAIISSAHGVCNYFYLVHDGKFYHADTVAELLARSSIQPKWNWQALADVLLLEHAVDHQTIHPDISRVGPSTVVRFASGRLTVTSRAWEQVHPLQRATAEQALAAANAEIARWFSNPVAVSMSGGFDSRLILAGMVKQGLKPDLLLTMGFSQSTDVTISEAIGSRLSCKVQRVELQPGDYLEHASRIVRLTNCTKLANHWHTHVYTRKAGLDPKTRLYVGSNGEFCRSFLLDKGVLSAIANYMPRELALKEFWNHRFRSPFRDGELREIHPDLAALLNGSGRKRWVERMAARSPGKLLPGLDQFYLRQRVGNFISNGMKLYSDNSMPIAPLLSPDWTRLVWNLERKWKLGNNWHRFAIERNCPMLLEFPEEKTGKPMSPHAPPFYWARGKGNRSVPYARYGEWFSQGVIWEFVRANAALIDDVISREGVESICSETQERQNRVPAMAFLLTLMVWKQETQIASQAKIEELA